MPPTTIVQPARPHGTTRTAGVSRDRAHERRAARAAARQVVWQESRLPRLRDCGRVSIAPEGRVGVRVTGSGCQRVAGFAGLATCGSVWACPVCSAQIMVRRREDVAQAVEAVRARGWSIVMVTLTVQHHDHHTLTELWDAVSTGWSAVTSGAGWVGGKVRADGTHAIGDKERYGIVGYIRAAEVTTGENGWHPHVHALIICDAPMSDDGAAALGYSMWKRWNRALQRKGYGSKILYENGQATAGLRATVIRGEDAGDVLGDYFTKAVYNPGASAGDIASEITLGGLTKDGRLKGRTPMQLLASIVETGDADDLDLWHEWETASKGRRALTWSRGLRDLLGLDAEQTDEEIAAEEIGTAADTVVVLTGDGWRTLRDSRRACELLDLLEDSGPAAVRRWLADHDIEWLEPTQL